MKAAGPAKKLYADEHEYDDADVDAFQFLNRVVEARLPKLLLFLDETPKTDYPILFWAYQLDSFERDSQQRRDLGSAVEVLLMQVD